LINDVIDLVDRDELTSISLDLILSILGGNDEGRVGGREMSIKDGLISDSGILISNSFGIS
jgi:hypothetical protein